MPELKNDKYNKWFGRTAALDVKKSHAGCRFRGGTFLHAEPVSDGEIRLGSPIRSSVRQIKPARLTRLKKYGVQIRKTLRRGGTDAWLAASLGSKSIPDLQTIYGDLAAKKRAGRFTDIDKRHLELLEEELDKRLESPHALRARIDLDLGFEALKAKADLFEEVLRNSISKSGNRRS